MGLKMEQGKVMYELLKRGRRNMIKLGPTYSVVLPVQRDREKDQNNPDYDRSCRYVRGFVPSHDFSLRASSIQPSFLQYDPGFHQLG
ncbi:cAMP-regulated phosphoprotein 21-like isoform X1 [Iris pallida]|uniref:cAMP-regulated phosphoprotein 21-like isoform X1 n=1 Tax=Iris pallida TaxID=29817 RepID=A0AAX6H2K6_IRIPA|nr:cAMP-regulated phosphoprotein 21-like isoform X1 [Iris pallida]